MHVVAQPVAPKVLPLLDEWSGLIMDDLELNDYSIEEGDFTKVRRLEVEGCVISAVHFESAALDRMQISDTRLHRLDAAGMRAPEAAWLRVVCENGRFTGADLGAALLEDCIFENVKFDEAGLRFAVLKRVKFVNCVLKHADLSGAKLSHVSFSGCDFEGTNFDKATCVAVDMRGENLAAIKGVLGLKGVTVSSDQVMQLAPAFATEVGLDVDYET